MPLHPSFVRPFALLPCLLPLAAAACTPVDATPEGAGSSDAGPAVVTDAGAPDANPDACTGTCERPPPTERMLQQATSLETMVSRLARSSGWHGTVDIAAASAAARTAIETGDGTDETFFTAAWHAFHAVPQGHQTFYPTDGARCGSALPYQGYSRFGVCGRPVAGGLVVTHARSENLLGLAAGDVIVGMGTTQGAALLDAAYLWPTCGAVYPSPAGRRYAAAATFFGGVPSGTSLTVRRLDGSTREVTVPKATDADLTDCLDPFARNRRIYAEATTRSDGVAVIRLPSFFPYDKAFPTSATEAELNAFVAEYQAAIVAVFDTVKTAPGIVWDARGNAGGITSVGLAIVGGFSTATATSLSYCRTRQAGAQPPTFLPDRYATYTVTPGGPFAYAGKVAVITDGLAYSAGDYFPLAVLKASRAPVIGSATAGAYGGGNAPLHVAGPPALDVSIDPSACFDAATDAPLEGAPPAPTFATEDNPVDLAVGRDTLVERAVATLGL